MCPPALTLLVNCHKQEMQCFGRLSGLERIWEINSHCWGKGGSLGSGSPKPGLWQGVWAGPTGEQLGTLWAARRRLTFSPGCPFSPCVSGTHHSHMQEGAGGRERERKRHKHRRQRQEHAPLPPNPGCGVWVSRVASAPTPALLPILTPGCPSREQPQNAALSQTGLAQGRVMWIGQLRAVV